MSEIIDRPAASSNKFETSLRAVIARKNLIRFINNEYGPAPDDKKAFLKELKNRLLRFGRHLEGLVSSHDFDSLKEVLDELREQPEGRRTITDTDVADKLRSRIALSVNSPERKLDSDDAKLIELLFDLPEGSLSQITKKMPAFVLLQCKGNTAMALMEKIKGHRIVDEVALITGDADLFIRIFGTNSELQKFLLDDLYRSAQETAEALEYHSAADSIIYSTKTYTSFEDSYFQKYPTATHPDFLRASEFSPTEFGR